jgi:hypothetical protein
LAARSPPKKGNRVAEHLLEGSVKCGVHIARFNRNFTPSRFLFYDTQRKKYEHLITSERKRSILLQQILDENLLLFLFLD